MHRVRRLRPSLTLLASAAVLAGSVVVLPGAARAEDGAPAGVTEGQTVVGELVQAYSEPGPVAEGAGLVAVDHGAGLLSWVQTAQGASVRVPTEDVTDLDAGSTVRITVGAAVADAAADQGLQPAHEVLAAEVLVPPSTDGQTTAQATAAVNHRVTVVMVVPAGGTQDSTTLADVEAAVNGPVAAFWAEQSSGVVRLGVVAGFDWAPSVAGCDDASALWAEAATRAGWSYADGSHLLVYVPYGSPGCAYGLAEVRQSTSSGGRLYVGAPETSVIAHEFGHNFGLNHSSELQCTGTVEASPSSSCQVTSYRDYYDVMGVSWDQIGTLSALQQSQLGELPTGNAGEIPASGAATTYTLAPLSGGTGIQAVRLVTPSGKRYWLEYRSAAGQDSWLGTAANWVGVKTGVLVRRENPGSPTGDFSLLLDPTPSAATSWSSDVSMAFPVGAAVPVDGGAFTVKVAAVTSTAATLSVTATQRISTETYESRRASTHLLRSVESATVYVVSGGSKYPIADMATLSALSPLGAVGYVSQQYLDRRTTGPRMSRVVLAPSGSVYFVDAGIKLPFSSCAQVADYGASCASLVSLEQPLIDALHGGPPITALYRTTSGKAFYVSGGVKREVVDDAALTQAGLPTSGVTLLETGLASLPYGVPVTRDGVVVRNRATGAVTLSAGGAFTTVSEGVRAATALASLPVRSLDDASVGRLSASAALGPWVKEVSGSRVFLLTEQGKKLVTSPVTVPASVPVLGDAVLGMFPDAGTLDPGVFLKGSGAGSVYVLREGSRRAVGSWKDLVALNGGNPSPRILTIDQRVADVLPAGPAQLGPGSLVVAPRNATVYFVNGTDELIPVRSFAPTIEVGATRVTRVTNADVDAYSVRSSGISTAVDCGGTQYLGLGGKLYRVGSDVVDAYRLSFTTVDPVACAGLPKAAGGLTRFLRADSGTIYHIEAGTKRPIGSYAGYQALGGTSATTIQASDFALSLIPTGAAR